MGGRPMMDTRPMAMHVPVKGMALPMPLRPVIFWVPARRMNPPAARNKRSFITAWLTTWVSEPTVAAQVPMESTRPISPIWARVE